MPLDVLGCTRATLKQAKSFPTVIAVRNLKSADVIGLGD